MGATAQQHISVFVQLSRIHHCPLTDVSKIKLIARTSKYVGRNQTLKLCQESLKLWMLMASKFSSIYPSASNHPIEKTNQAQNQRFPIGIPVSSRTDANHSFIYSQLHFLLLTNQAGTLTESLNHKLMALGPAVDVLHIIGGCLEVACRVVALRDEDVVVEPALQRLIQWNWWTLKTKIRCLCFNLNVC